MHGDADCGAMTRVEPVALGFAAARGVGQGAGGDDAVVFKRADVAGDGRQAQLQIELQLALGDVAVRCEVADDGLPVARLGDVSGCGDVGVRGRHWGLVAGLIPCGAGRMTPLLINNFINLKKGAKRQLTKILKISQVVFRAFFLALIDKIFVLLEHFSNTL